jgi:hypothetical protein
MTAEEYVQHAEECEHLAAMAKLGANRHALLSSAEMWRKMAADATAGDGAGPRPQITTAPTTER